MKKVLFAIVALIISAGLFAQSNTETPKTKKVETIKIVDGDTVMHDVRFVDGDHHRNQYRKRHQKHEMERANCEVMESRLEDIDVFIHCDDAHKNMIVKKMNRHNCNLDSILKTIEDEEDLIIDIDKENGQIKVIKMDIEEKDGEEITLIEIRKGKGEYEKQRYGQNLKVYPNPSRDEFNIEINTLDKNTIVTVTDQNGKNIFNKTYEEIGQYSEQIKLKGVKKGFVVVTMSGETTEIQKKLIVE